MKRAKLLLFLLLIVFSLTAVAYADTYKNGSKGKEVEEIQQQLKKSGLFQGEITGFFGPQTATAVKKFQVKKGLHADGVVGNGTYKYLFESVNKTQSSSAKTESATKHVISIKDIQTALKKLGYYTSTVDGVAGGNTEDAIKKFQKANKLTADGVVGNGTSKLLLAAADKTAKSESVSNNAMSIKEIQNALKKLGYYAGTVDGVTGSRTKAAIQKFQKSNKLTADGVVGTTTKNKLIAAASSSGTIAKASTTTTTTKVSTTTTKDTTTATASQSKGGVELLDWWTKASKVFKIGSTATVTDTKTGRTFKIVRTYGTNHADVEALTAKDSETIKDIWGGWSWTRRPVIIEVNETRIAASMAAMPHAGLDSQPANTYVSQRSGGYSRGANLDKIKSNGMSGHMDVHFLNSKTHGTNKVDPKHQAAVKQAAKY